MYVFTGFLTLWTKPSSLLEQEGAIQWVNLCEHTHSLSCTGWGPLTVQSRRLNWAWTSKADCRPKVLDTARQNKL